MKVGLIGSVSSSACVLRGLIRSGVPVTCVLGLDRSHAQGVSDYRDLRPMAEKTGLPYRAFRRVRDPDVIDFVRARRPDLLFVVGLSQLAPRELLDLAAEGAVGFHPTPLPRGRGRAPVAWTILLGAPAAANLFFLTDDADAGDIIDQRPVEVRPDDYAQDLIDRTNEVLEQMVVDLAPAIRSGKIPRRPQDPAEATWYGKRTPEDGRIDWNRSAREVHRLIRAASRPYPGAFTHDRGEKRIVWRAEIHDRDDHVGTCGQVVRVDPRHGPLVQCGQGHLWLTEVQDAAGRPVGPEAFGVGVRLGRPVERTLEELQQRVAALEHLLERTRGGSVRSPGSQPGGEAEGG